MSQTLAVLRDVSLSRLLAKKTGLNCPGPPTPREPISRKQRCLLFTVYCERPERKFGEILSSQSTKIPGCAVVDKCELGT